MLSPGLRYSQNALPAQTVQGSFVASATDGSPQASIAAQQPSPMPGWYSPEDTSGGHAEIPTENLGTSFFTQSPSLGEESNSPLFVPDGYSIVTIASDMSRSGDAQAAATGSPSASGQGLMMIWNGQPSIVPSNLVYQSGTSYWSSSPDKAGDWFTLVSGDVTNKVWETPISLLASGRNSLGDADINDGTALDGITTRTAPSDDTIYHLSSAGDLNASVSSTHTESVEPLPPVYDRPLWQRENVMLQVAVSLRSSHPERCPRGAQWVIGQA